MKSGHSIFAFFFFLSFTSAFAHPPFSLYDEDGKSRDFKGTLHDIAERQWKAGELL